MSRPRVASATMTATTASAISKVLRTSGNKVSSREAEPGVERVFPLYAPMIDSIKVVRRGKVRRAKLYYLRGRRGKSARITERQDHTAGGEGKTAE